MVQYSAQAGYAGLTLLVYRGAYTVLWRGVATRARYRFTRGGAPRWVDARDACFMLQAQDAGNRPLFEDVTDGRAL